MLGFAELSNRFGDEVDYWRRQQITPHLLWRIHLHKYCTLTSVCQVWLWEHDGYEELFVWDNSRNCRFLQDYAIFSVPIKKRLRTNNFQHIGLNQQTLEGMFGLDSITVCLKRSVTHRRGRDEDSGDKNRQRELFSPTNLNGSGSSQPAGTHEISVDCCNPSHLLAHGDLCQCVWIWVYRRDLASCNNSSREERAGKQRALGWCFYLMEYLHFQVYEYMDWVLVGFTDLHYADVLKPHIVLQFLSLL